MAQTAKVAVVIDAATIAVNKGGRDAQITPNQTWFVKRTQGTVITDPDSNQELGTYGDIMGWLTVVNVFPHFCICMPTDSSITYTRGDVLEIDYNGPSTVQTS